MIRLVLLVALACVLGCSTFGELDVACEGNGHLHAGDGGLSVQCSSRAGGGPAVDATAPDATLGDAGADASDAGSDAFPGVLPYWWEPVSVVAVGDSTVEPWGMALGVNVSWVDEVPLTYGPVLNYGISGKDCSWFTNPIVTSGWVGYGSYHANRVLFVGCGGNDIFHGATAEQAWTSACGVAAQGRLSGFTWVIGQTLWDRNWTSTTAPIAAEYNGIVRARWHECLDDVADPAADPLLGSPGARLDPRFFRDTVTHLSKEGMGRFWAVHNGPAFARALAHFQVTP